MRWTIPVLLAALASACAWHAPDSPTTVIPAPSTAPASIRLVGATRPDRSLDITATVLTASGAFVPGVRVDLATSAGSLSPTSGVTDGTGTVKSILTTGGNATVSAQAAGIAASVNVLGTPDNTPAPIPPVPPLGPVTPTPPALSVTIAVAGSPTAGTATTFGLSTSALSSATWNFGDGTIATTTGTGQATHTYLAAGSYTVSVTVTDTLGRTASTSTGISVAAAAATPVPAGSAGLVITLGCTPANHGSATPCNVSASYNGVALPSANISSVSWDWGDGNPVPATGISVAHTYVNAGSFPVFATVNATTVDGAKSATVSKSVTIP